MAPYKVIPSDMTVLKPAIECCLISADLTPFAYIRPQDEKLVNTTNLVKCAYPELHQEENEITSNELDQVSS